VQCSIMYVQCNKAKIRFSRRQASFQERAQLSVLQRLQWLTADDENRLALTAQTPESTRSYCQNRRGPKTHGVEYQRVRRRVLGEAGQYVAKTAAVRHHRNAVRDRPESLSAFKWNACPPSTEYPLVERSRSASQESKLENHQRLRRSSAD